MQYSYVKVLTVLYITKNLNIATCDFQHARWYLFMMTCEIDMSTLIACQDHIIVASQHR